MISGESSSEPILKVSLVWWESYCRVTGKVYCQPASSTVSQLKFSSTFRSVQITNGILCESVHYFDIIDVLHPIPKMTCTGMFFSFQKLANMCTVGFEPILDSGGNCLDFLGAGWGALAAVLYFHSFWLTIVNCLWTQFQLQWVVLTNL
jgi:hypothetical protein